MKKYFHRISHIIYAALCIVGLLYQVSLLSKSYFKYDVSNNVQLHYAKKSPDDALNVCFYYQNIFKYDEYENHTGISLGINFSYTLLIWEIGQHLIENLTIDEMLKYTPSIDESIQGCSLRKSQPNKLQSYYDTKECNKRISVSKSVFNFFVCYRFLFPVIPDGGMDPILISSDLYDPFSVQGITFNSILFKNVGFFLILINDRNSTLEREFITATTTYRGHRRDTNINGFNLFGVRSYQSIVRNLEPPYTTMCKNYSHMDCLTKCIEEKILYSLNRSSPMAFYNGGYRKLMTGKYLDRNLEKTSIYLKIVDTCKKNCPWSECEISVHISSIDEQMKYDTFDVHMLLQNTASIEVNNVPKMYFIDYMTFVSSCFGTWLGISFLGLNPFKFSSKLFQPGIVLPAHNQEFSCAEYDQKLVRMSQNYRHLFRLLFQKVKNQQEWIEELDQKMARDHERR